MINFIVMLEDMLRNSGRDDWELIYLPEVKAYVLKIDGTRIYLEEGEPYDRA